MIHKDTATQEYALVMCAGPTAVDPDRYAAKLLATVLGDETGSRLYWELVDSGLAEHCSLHHHDYLDAGVFFTYISCDPEHAEENLRRIRKVYAQAETDGVTQAELDQAKNKINSRVVLSSERPRGRLFTVGANWIQRREYRSVRDDLDAVEKITLADLAAVLKKFPLTNSITFAVGPLEKIARAGIGFVRPWMPWRKAVYTEACNAAPAGVAPYSGDWHVSAAGQQRRTVYYTGRVQGVGFRYTARSLAQSFAVDGNGAKPGRRPGAVGRRGNRRRTRPISDPGVRANESVHS